MTERKPRPGEQDSFLSRWSRRKLETREGVQPVEPPVPPTRNARPVGPAEPAGAGSAAAIPQIPEASPALPSLADVRTLTADSDFVPFMARGVAPGVRNAAMKKLFADPHFNVMDGLDIYIDDYTKTTPLSTAMVKSMTSAKFLGLFDDNDATNAQAAEAATHGQSDPSAGQSEERDEPQLAAGPLRGAEPRSVGPEPSEES